MELDSSELRARLAATGLEGEALDYAARKLEEAAASLSVSTIPEARREESWETLFDALTAPRDLDRALDALENKLTQKDIAWFRGRPESELPKLHLTLGGWIRSRWCGRPESPLMQWFKARRVNHADDMSELVLRSFHRRLNGHPIDLEEQLAQVQSDVEAEPEGPLEDSADRIRALGGLTFTVPPEQSSE